jgi:hypothetical protein
MNPVEEIPFGVDERTERLISRLLDGEITSEEQAELDGTLAGNPAAQALLHEYRRIDARAAEALRCDFYGVTTTVAPRRRSGLWLATAGGLLAAAAVVAFSFLPDLWSGRTGSGEPSRSVPMVMRDPGPPVDASAGMDRNGFVPPAQFADYRNADQRPVRRLRDVQRDWIGIPSADGKTIFFIERKTQTTKLTPISGDF